MVGEPWVVVGTAINSAVLASVTVMTERRMLAVPERAEAFRAYQRRTSVLIPWNTCGAFMAATLGVATFEYAPYALFNLICPVLAVIFGYLMIAQPRAEATSA